MKHILQIMLAAVFVALCVSTVSYNKSGEWLHIEKMMQASSDKLEGQMGGFVSIEACAQKKLSLEEQNTIYVFNKNEGRIKLSVMEYLIGVIAAEMPASYNIEALKAQAVASRTYLFYKMINGGCSRNEKCAICTTSGHCQGYLSLEQRKQRWGERFDEYEQKITEAVSLKENQ